jgi:UDP-2,3-diacylglucosamine pyrophosphatase LpxH
VKEKKDYVRLVISDLHLGSACAQEKKLYEFLKNIEFDEIILAGDIIEFLKKPKFTETTAALFDLVGKLKNKKIIYIVGNHDNSFCSFIGKNVGGIEFVKKYDFEYANRRYRIEHGDDYDSGIVNWNYTMQFISFVQDMIERYFRIDLTTWWANRQIKKRKLKRIWDIVKWNEEADVFIMGHTHNPEVLIWVDKNEKIKTYVNTGDWIVNCTYVLIKDGQVRLRKVNSNKD